MDMLKLLMKDQDPSSLLKLGEQFGVSPDKAGDVIQGLMGGVMGGVQNNIQSGGVASLLGALQKGNHSEFLNDVPNLLNNEKAVNEGNGILGHVLGSKEESRNLATKVSEDTGVNSDLIKKMLPIVATVIMGTLSKQKDAAANGNGEQGQDLLSQMLSSAMGGNNAGNDGLGLDDVLSMAGKFLK